MKHKGRSIELFLVDGDPDGMMTASIPFQWTGHVLVANRTQLKRALNRPEASRAGVYLLYGEDEERGPLLYIGESDDIGNRTNNHLNTKDWWSKVYFISSNADVPLNKAHIRYLESKLVEKARQVGKIDLDNGNRPGGSALTEAAEAHMEDFLENIYLVLPTLRFDYFQEDTKQPEAANDPHPQINSPVFVLDAKRQNIMATARIEDDKFVVEKGSQAREKWVGEASKESGYAKIYRDLIERNILVEADGCKVFTSSYKFNSPSAAAAVIKGRMANGAKAWKIKGTQTTYKEWEAEDLLEQMME